MEVTAFVGWLQVSIVKGTYQEGKWRIPDLLRSQFNPILRACLTFHSGDHYSISLLCYRVSQYQEPCSMLEPDEVKVSSPFLRGERDRKVPDLPDLPDFLALPPK
jgi:hypothetical protein